MAELGPSKVLYSVSIYTVQCTIVHGENRLRCTDTYLLTDKEI